MAICMSCRKEMMDASATSCEEKTVKYPDGEVLQAVPYNPKKLHMPDWFRCPDCNVAPGGTHHYNCDQAHCPRCGGQLISCDCFDGKN